MTPTDHPLEGDANAGLSAIDWARRAMPLSGEARSQLSNQASGHIGVALPLDRATAYLCMVLVEAGFEASLFVNLPPPGGSDLVAALRHAGVQVCTDRNVFLSQRFDILLDTNGEVLDAYSGDLLGAMLSRQHSLEPLSRTSEPILDCTASSFLNLTVQTHGVGQACVSGFLDITNLQIAGSQVLILGYDAIGEGLAKYARAYGARPLVWEPEPAKAARAILDGLTVTALQKAVPQSLVVFNATAQEDTFNLEQVEQLPDGAFLCSATSNMRAFPAAQHLCKLTGKVVRDEVVRYDLATGAHVKIVCGGRALHEMSGRGLPLEYADIEIAAQLRSISALLSGHDGLRGGVQPMPAFIEEALIRGFVSQSRGTGP